MSNDMVKKTNKEAAEVEVKTEAAEEARIEEVEVRPVVDIIGEAENVTIFFEVPGANAKTVDVEVDDGVLYVNAKSSLRRNGRQVVYKRAFQISDAVDVAGISAKTSDGVLTLTLPKSERAKVHKIKVN